MRGPNIGDRAGAWECVGTGGGCTAWTRNAQGAERTGDETAPRWLITDAMDATAPRSDARTPVALNLCAEDAGIVLGAIFPGMAAAMAAADAFDSATDPDPLPCPMCEGSGYTENGARTVQTCGGCDGSGAGIRCACGAEIVPNVARVTHTEGDAGSGDGEGLHTPETCCTYTPRDAWQIAGEYDSPLPGSVADFCEAFYESHGYCWTEVGQ